jgi:hypothetical protein
LTCVYEGFGMRNGQRLTTLTTGKQMNTIALKRLTDSTDAVVQITNSNSIGPITLPRGQGPEAGSKNQIEVAADVADNIEVLTSIVQCQLVKPRRNARIAESGLNTVSL